MKIQALFTAAFYLTYCDTVKEECFSFTLKQKTNLSFPM